LQARALDVLLALALALGAKSSPTIASRVAIATIRPAVTESTPRRTAQWRCAPPSLVQLTTEIERLVRKSACPVRTPNEPLASSARSARTPSSSTTI
jgi:hypothetical protein